MHYQGSRKAALSLYLQKASNVEFNLADIRIHIESDNPYKLQHAIMLRGSSQYPQFCREAVCHYPDNNCYTCKCRTECQYHLVFRQELATDPEALKKHQKPPLPYAFSFPEISNNKLVCRLAVVGNAISSLEMLLEGFVTFIKNSELDDDCTIEKITSSDYQGTESTIGTENRPFKHKDNLILLASGGILDSSQNLGNMLSISLISPLKLVAHGKIQHSLSFKQFFTAVMRRVSAIGYYYAGYEFDMDYKEVSKQADNVEIISGAFIYDNQNVAQLSGITGEGVFRGINEEQLPFLLLGSFLNVGKGAAYGFGGYRINHS